VVSVLRRGRPSWRLKSTTRSGLRQGIVVNLRHAAKYKGQYIGEGRLKGQCAAGVQLVFIAAEKPLRLTSTWKEGIKVKGNKIKPGTAIASFRPSRLFGKVDTQTITLQSLFARRKSAWRSGTNGPRNPGVSGRYDLTTMAIPPIRMTATCSQSSPSEDSCPLVSRSNKAPADRMPRKRCPLERVWWPQYAAAELNGVWAVMEQKTGYTVKRQVKRGQSKIKPLIQSSKAPSSQAQATGTPSSYGDTILNYPSSGRVSFF